MDQKKLLPKEVWDQRARQWFDTYEADKQSARHGWERAKQTADFLIEQGLLTPQTVMADVGCGLGRFDLVCARTAKQVTGFDFSEEMLSRARIYAAREERENVEFCTYDFNSRCVPGQEDFQKFDLVTSCLTPVIDSEETLNNMMSLGKHRFFISSILKREDSLVDVLKHAGVDALKNHKANDERFGKAFQFLVKLGYEPRVFYCSDVKSESMKLDEDEVRAWVSRTLGHQMIEASDMDRMMKVLKERMDADGTIRRDSIYRYVYMWWLT